MLQAKNKTGQVIPVWRYNHRQLKLLQQHEIFYCPDCKEEVILKVGQKNTPHFAHKIDSTCVQRGEGAYHDSGKRDLYEWLQKQGFKVELEAYIPKIKQRPDLLLQLKSKQIAIEYQCASLSREEVKRRTRGYQKINIFPIWILGANKLYRTQPHVANIPINDQVFLYQFHVNFPLSIFYYCSDTKRFIIYQDIIFLSKTKTYGQMNIGSIYQLQWRDLFHSRYHNLHSFRSYWKKEKEKWRQRPIPFHQKKETAWRQWLYINKLNVQSMPFYVYLPIRMQYRLKTPPWIWQSRLYIDLLLAYNVFTCEDAYHLLRNHYHPTENFPLIKKHQDPIDEYLQLLLRIGILKRKSSKTYQFIRSTV